MAKMDITKTELVWPGKYSEDGTLKEVPRVSLPFQVIETVNESRATREVGKSIGVDQDCGTDNNPATRRRRRRRPTVIRIKGSAGGKVTGRPARRAALVEEGDLDTLWPWAKPRPRLCGVGLAWPC
jgi:hypothetical protein